MYLAPKLASSFFEVRLRYSDYTIRCADTFLFSAEPVIFPLYPVKLFPSVLILEAAPPPGGELPVLVAPPVGCFWDGRRRRLQRR